MLVAAANELVFLFVGLELVSIPTYLLLYLSRRNSATQEAATKYFFLSIFASGLLLYGLAFLYGSTGISNLKALGFLFDKLPNSPQPQLGLIAIVFVMAGLCFRVAAVPLHFYAPDVYQGSPIVDRRGSGLGAQGRRLPGDHPGADRRVRANDAATLLATRRSSSRGSSRRRP